MKQKDVKYVKIDKKSHFIEIKRKLIMEWKELKLKGRNEKRSCEIL
jgi:hypothetical protein